MSSVGPSKTGSTSLGSKDAIVVAEGDREMAQSAAAWQALFRASKSSWGGSGLLSSFSSATPAVQRRWRSGWHSTKSSSRRAGGSTPSSHRSHDASAQLRSI